jgi:deoxycytidine triphosphate deaminase
MPDPNRNDRVTDPLILSLTSTTTHEFSKVYNPTVMIIPGQAVLSRQIVCAIRSSKHQMQPCGIDLSLKRVLRWESAGVVDFDNAHRKTSATAEIPFQKLHIADGHSSSQNQSEDSIHLAPGEYLVEFNETVDTPLDVMGQLFVRSSLFRSGALVSAGVMDAGYKGAIGE